MQDREATAMKTRTAYIDTTRAILIFLVVLGHVLNYADPEYKVVHQFLSYAGIFCAFRYADGH